MATQAQGGDEAAIAARAVTGARFATRLDLPGGALVADEPVSVGGGGSGPTPYQLLSAALAACTSMTLRLYAGRKGWTLPDFTVEVAHALIPGSPPRDRFTRRILFAAAVAPEDEARLLDMADRCPVHRTLSGGGAEIVTSTALVPPPAAALAPADPPEQHLLQMEQASSR
ncbi:MAG TPA: OsmC family protein [Allosphingosinicella sp.]|jgi:putative redox protein